MRHEAGRSGDGEGIEGVWQDRRILFNVWKVIAEVFGLPVEGVGQVGTHDQKRKGRSRALWVDGSLSFEKRKIGRFASDKVRGKIEG